MKQKSKQKKRNGKTDYRQYSFSGKEWMDCWLEIIGIAVVVNYLCYRSWWAFVGIIPESIWYIQWKKKRKGKEWMDCWLEIIGIAVVVNYLCYRSWWAFVGIIPESIWYIQWKKKRKGEKRRQKLCYHFRDVLQGLLTAVRAGYSMEQAVPECRKEMEQMYGKEEDLVKELLYMEHQIHLQGLLTAVRAGYSMEQAVPECRKEMEQMYGKEEDLVKELLYMEHQIQVGVPVEKLFLDLGSRSGVEDIRNFGEIFVISRRAGGNLGEIMEQMARVLGEKIRVQREIEVCISGKRMEQLIMSLVPGGMTGGNLGEIMEQMARVLGEKIRVQREIEVCISGKRMEQLIMSLVPGGMIFYIQLTSQGFLDVLYHNVLGVLVMTCCLLLYAFSFWMGRKIVRISI